MMIVWINMFVPRWYGRAHPILIPGERSRYVLVLVIHLSDYVECLGGIPCNLCLGSATTPTIYCFLSRQRKCRHRREICILRDAQERVLIGKQ